MLQFLCRFKGVFRIFRGVFLEEALSPVGPRGVQTEKAKVKEGELTGCQSRLSDHSIKQRPTLFIKISKAFEEEQQSIIHSEDWRTEHYPMVLPSFPSFHQEYRDLRRRREIVSA
tara:strand:- start:541 stop:885 length:345 start_codon:yes stop_codon:yes gene_type:complete